LFGTERNVPGQLTDEPLVVRGTPAARQYQEAFAKLDADDAGATLLQPLFERMPLAGSPAFT
jgi:hypothetical protein